MFFVIRATRHCQICEGGYCLNNMQSHAMDVVLASISVDTKVPKMIKNSSCGEQSAFFPR